MPGLDLGLGLLKQFPRDRVVGNSAPPSASEAARRWARRRITRDREANHEDDIVAALIAGSAHTGRGLARGHDRNRSVGVFDPAFTYFRPYSCQWPGQTTQRGVQIGSRKQKFGMRGQAEARDISYLISYKPCMTEGRETSCDAGKFALLERSR